MSSIAVIDDQGVTALDELARPIKQKLQQARDDRRSMEPIWHSNAAFASGKHWLEWSRTQRQLVLPVELQNKELYTADVITEVRETALGELGSDDDRPELLLRRDDSPSEDFQKEMNKAVAFGWDNEWHGDEALEEADRLCVDLGTSAVRCRFDPTVGSPAGEVPHLNGVPVHDPQKQMELFANGPNPGVTMQAVKQGAISWDPLSAFNLLVPSGIPNEKHFPWEGVVRPALLSKVQEEYGDVAADLKEDGDIGSILGYDSVTGSQGAPYDLRQTGGGRPGRLRDHVWLFTYYERPSNKWPQGRVVVLAGNRMKPLAFYDRLPYQAPDGTFRSGIAYFHWWRVTGRFWSRALVETMKDTQRGINKRRTQINEIVDRGMPFWMVEKNSEAMSKQGTPMEFIELQRDERIPIAHPGIAPGAWMQADVEAMREDLEHATGIHGLRMGESVAQIKTYSELALLNENDQVKRQPIQINRKRSIAQLVEDSVYDIRTYWGPQKQINLAGDEDQIESQVFDATKVPPFFIVKVAKGAPKPRGQASQLKMVEDIWAGVLNSGAVQHDPQGYVAWLKNSMTSGEPLDLPESESDSQAKVAEFENFMMLNGGEPSEPAEYDFAAVHVPIHREGQDQARASGDMQAFWRIQDHIDATIQMATHARKAWRVLDPADTNDVASDIALDEDQALKENDMMVHGVPLNPEALQQARNALVNGNNPDTGQPLQPTDDPAAVLMRASLKPTLVENLQVHLDRHGKVLKSDEFKTYPADVRARFLSHYDQTRELFLSLPMMPTEVKAPHVTLALRESVGASTVAKVLQRAGVPDADATVLAQEPPMENMVTRDDTPPPQGGNPPPTP